MVGWLIAAGYVVGAAVGARCAVRFMARVDRRYGLPLDEAWSGGDWIIVIYTAIAWPIAIPVGHLMTHESKGRGGFVRRVQRLLQTGVR